MAGWINEPQAADWLSADRSWLARTACRYGHVGVQGDERLAAFTDPPRIGASSERWRLSCRRRGDAEVRVVFHVEHPSEVLAILRPDRRRQVSEAERARLAAVGATHRYGTGAGHGVQSDFTATGSTEDGAGTAPSMAPAATPRDEARRRV